MPVMRTTTELQRNMGDVAALCHQIKEPIYITKNGEADLVLMDAAAFEHALDLRNAAFEREVRTLEGIERGREEIAAGKGRPYAAIREQLSL
ncbi:MAG TPA: type II toxin-antitoxin system Phd/YefM family antitoxin [Coriobacteriaceae bacterium]|nr:type II toxin-antitoxin system Phd/YefM family antitoxin [Coriobacteriaceae bacterium]